MNLGLISSECICGSNMWKTWVIFDDYEIAAYGLSLECMGCGNIATAPTLLDKPEGPDDNYVTA